MNITTIEEVRAYIEDMTDETVSIFDNYDYATAFIGLSLDNRAVYDFDLMVIHLMEKENWDVTDAMEWISYNTIRSLPYMENSPIIITTLD